MPRLYGAKLTLDTTVCEIRPGPCDDICWGMHMAFAWQVFLHFSYMHASEVNPEALYRVELGVEASGQCGCSAVMVASC